MDSGQNAVQDKRSVDEQAEETCLEQNPIAQRVIPKQTRAHKRIASILDATEILLAQNANVTTSTIAKQAEIPVGSIYRYFPNIMGIYSALFKKLNDRMHLQIAITFKNADEATDGPVAWRDLFRRIMAVVSDAYIQYPALGVLLLMVSSPELRPIKKASNATMANAIEGRYQAGLNGFHGGDPKIVATTVIELISWFELSVFVNKGELENSEALYAEGLKVIEAYLSLYLTD
ncbi:MAG: hypothetical protein COA69_05605 [Robiginitomaculum sp.]|nr:MAG: hypothetical protein COA69_05605 [Robiginitomaculum sp.]